MGHMIFSMLVFVLAQSGVISKSGKPSKADLIYNFEGDFPTEITAPQSSAQLSTTVFKKGSQSLKWEWSAGKKLSWNLSQKNVKIKSNQGIKVWIHNSKPLAQKCLSLCVRQKRGKDKTSSCFPLSLNFKGWRGVWVSYGEFLGCRQPSTTAFVRNTPNYKGTVVKFLIKAPSDVISPSVLHIDFLQFTKVSIATRDLVVPPLVYVRSAKNYCINCGKIHSGLTQADALLKHKRKSFWQHIYRWSLQPAYPALASSVDDNKKKAIDEITKRLLDWYANEDKALTIIPHTASSTFSFLRQRWASLLPYFNRAPAEYKKLTKGGSDDLTSGLFPRNDKSKVRGGPEEFSFVHSKVLLPLTLEFHLKSRPIEVEHVACEVAKKYTCSSSKPLDYQDLEAIIGTDASLNGTFKSSYNSAFTSTSQKMHSKCKSVKQDCFDHVKKALDDVNNKRKQKIIKIFNYLEEQGLNKGSALGSMDHELLQMTGYLHSVFLMRKHLNSDIIDTMKWYVEFGEVYQPTFEFKGTTADRIRSAMLYRLMTVLVMPEENDTQKKEKIRDMDAYKRWVENALSLTEGLSGVIKPDYTCFHHKTFYASAYCPPALHTGALVSYFLEDTVYELGSKIKVNIIDALKVLRITAVLYSTPSQVGGRFPNYTKAALAQHVQAYAYMAMKSPSQDKNSNGEPNLNKDLAQVRMFLRLYKHDSGICDGILNRQLCNGTPSRIFYLNTLGSLEIIEKVKRRASMYTGKKKKWFYEAEKSPVGHWTKQFASLSIHRRKDWAVTVKGFDKFVWDFESGKDNVYGMYGSHGAMLIANSEAALKSKNIDKGWDWRKIPGTTVINAEYSDLAEYGKDSSRQYNPSANAMAGGLFFEGSKAKRQTRNGVFGIDFKQPSYRGKGSSPFSSNVNFSFKKSVYFYDDIIVSLGTNIEYDGGKYEILTTLFQDLMPTTSSPTTESTAPNIFHCNNGGPLEKTSWSDIALAILVDVNGNRYYIPKPDDRGLVFHRNQKQSSFKAKKKTPEATEGMYCTAFFNHTVKPSGAKSKYEYAVQIQAETVGSSGKKPLLDPKTRYTVIMDSTDVHAVQFKKQTGDARGNAYGYVVFPIAPSSAVNVGSTGPVESVEHQSIIMAEETTQPKKLYISVKSPQLDLQQKAGSPSWCSGGTTTPSRNGNVDETLLYCSKSTDKSVHVNLRNEVKWSELKSLHVGGKKKCCGGTDTTAETAAKSNHLTPGGKPKTKLLKFTKLRNGAETEVSFSNTGTFA